MKRTPRSAAIAILVVVSSTLAGSAEALDTRADRGVFLMNGTQSVPIGRIRCSLDRFVIAFAIGGGVVPYRIGTSVAAVAVWQAP